MGEGGEQNAPLGRAVIGGLLVASCYTLFVLPTLYAVFRKKAPAAEEALPEAELTGREKQAAEAKRNGRPGANGADGNGHGPNGDGPNGDGDHGDGADGERRRGDRRQPGAPTPRPVPAHA